MKTPSKNVKTGKLFRVASPNFNFPDAVVFQWEDFAEIGQLDKRRTLLGNRKFMQISDESEFNRDISIVFKFKLDDGHYFLDALTSFISASAFIRRFCK